MATNNIGKFDRVTGHGIMPAVKVLNHPKTIAAQTKVICVDAGAVIPEVEGSFAGKWRSRIAVGYEHL
jgi:hypothetical protein